MKSLWDDNIASEFTDSPLDMRVYTSRLLGRESSLVLHGGGNTSVKASTTNLFGETEELLYVKGSGWDLATIEAEGFAPVRLDVLQKMAELETLSDSEMVSVQRSAMTNPSAPNPSVEAILHAIIPFDFVDHTHADAVVTISNTADGEARIREIYGARILIVPYVMPGFVLAKTIRALTRDINWAELDGIILLNHGVFTFSDSVRESYEKMINLVSSAEDYLEKNASRDVTVNVSDKLETDLLKLAALRQAVSRAKASPMLAILNSSEKARAFSNTPDVASISTRGPLTPDHVIRTKRTAMQVDDSPAPVLTGLLVNTMPISNETTMVHSPVSILHHAGRSGRGTARLASAARSKRQLLSVISLNIPLTLFSMPKEWMAGRHCQRKIFLSWNIGSLSRPSWARVTPHLFSPVKSHWSQGPPAVSVVPVLNHY